MGVIINNAYAFDKDDEIVVQNTFNGLDLRETHRMGAKVVAKVRDGARGIILNKVKENGLTWYQVHWDSSKVDCIEPKKQPCSVGWSFLEEIGCEIFGTPEEADRRDAIVEKLFRGIPHEATNHEYNGHRCNPDFWDEDEISGYKGGHSGWDVQTRSVVGATPKGKPLVDEHFYSLTAGTVVIANPGETKGNAAVIAIYDKPCKKTTLYLHAREIDPAIIEKIGEDIDEGDYLGIQGNAGLWKLATKEDKEKYGDNPESFREHVHIEVIDGDIREMDGKFDFGANGAIETTNPIPYLYRWASGAQKADFLPSDVNHDGKVDFWDWLLVLASSLRNLLASYDPKCDVNSDGTVDKLDRDEVRKNRGQSPPNAPRISRQNPVDGITVRSGQLSINGKVIHREMVQQLLAIARSESDGSLTFKQGIAMLESLLAATVPERTVLLANYPNPFNPETWIPYYLASDANVTVTIHDITGAWVRRLEVGHQKAGYYTSRNRAAYWDGRTEVGEHVASGIYFYRLTTGNYTHTRKMVILK